MTDSPASLSYDPALLGGIVTLRPDAGLWSRQRLHEFVGVTAETGTAAALSINLVVIPPGAAAESSYDLGYQTAIFILEGMVCTRYGMHLERETINGMGDFLFVPPNLPHQPFNLSLTESATAIVVRNAP